MSSSRVRWQPTLFLFCLLVGEETGCDMPEETNALQQVADTPTPASRRVHCVRDLEAVRAA